MSSRTRVSALIAAGVVVVGGTALAAALGSENGGSTAPSTTSRGSVSQLGGNLHHAMPTHAPHQRQQGPTAAARMVCGDEIRDAVAATFGLDSVGPGSATFDLGRLYRCTYHLPRGVLVLSVKDSLTEVHGRAYFNAVRAFDGRPDMLTGLPAFGLPSYETAAGKVVFLKDGKTLVVDAGRLREPLAAQGQTRTEVAYAIAADVIGCWSE